MFQVHTSVLRSGDEAPAAEMGTMERGKPDGVLNATLSLYSKGAQAVTG